MKSRNPAVWRCALIAICILFMGCAMEFLMNCGELSLSKEDRKTREIPMEKISYEGFSSTQDGIEFEHGEGVIHIDLDGAYVGKLGYSYEYEGLLNLDAYVGVYNSYGEVREKDEIHIEDRNSRLVKESYLPIRKRVDYVNLVIDQSKLDEKGLDYIDFESYPLVFTGFFVKSAPVFNGYRLFFFWCVMGIAAMLWFGRGWIGRRMELAFLVISLSAGGLMVAALPANKAGWDEEIHFERAFWLATYPRGAALSDAVMSQFQAGIDTWPFNQPQGLEEQRQLNSYLDRNSDYKHGNNPWRAATDKPSFQGYLGSALFLKVGRLFNLPFSLLFRLGRLGNLLVYCAVMYFAIKKTPVGKGILAFIGLMPTPMFLACVYSYDPTVTAFLCLSFACMMKEILSPTGTVDGKSYALMAVSFIIGCRAKAVYAPLILIALLIPKERFKDRRQMYLMRSGIVAVFVLMMASFLLPVLISPSETGDLRGGATSEAGQMAYVLGYPVAYLGILIKNIWRTLPDYLAGEGAFGTFGHLGSVGHVWLLYAGATAVTLTNTQSSAGKALKPGHKAWIFALAALAIGLIWTAMYMAYTVPGETYIGGVQGRYYIPMLFVLYLIVNSRRVVVHLSNGDYYSMTLGLSGTILLLAVYEGILKPYCF